jgi:hypothetical protein
MRRAATDGLERHWNLPQMMIMDGEPQMKVERRQCRSVGERPERLMPCTDPLWLAAAPLELSRLTGIDVNAIPSEDSGAQRDRPDTAAIDEIRDAGVRAE